MSSGRCETNVVRANLPHGVAEESENERSDPEAQEYAHTVLEKVIPRFHGRTRGPLKPSRFPRDHRLDRKSVLEIPGETDSNR